jgi:methylated-DNA-[protein]-cysteine S-methyltransferase
VVDADGRLRQVDWVSGRSPPTDASRAPDPAGHSTALRAYFAGELAALDTLPVAPEGTAFEHEVWRALRSIPCGSTWSYAQLARAIGRPAAARAIGLANGRNPIALVVPCHRVIGADGSLTGYAGGLHRKQWLLAHEGALAQRLLFAERARVRVSRTR